MAAIFKIGLWNNHFAKSAVSKSKISKTFISLMKYKYTYLYMKRTYHYERIVMNGPTHGVPNILFIDLLFIFTATTTYVITICTHAGYFNDIINDINNECITRSVICIFGGIPVMCGSFEVSLNRGNWFIK
jgi:hypothetical protein